MIHRRLEVGVLLLAILVAGIARAQDLAPGRVALRADEVDKAAGKRLGGVRRCYKAALDRSDRSYGTIGIGLRVAPDGRVTDRWVALSTLADAKLEECIIASFDGLVLPAPGEGGAIVRYGVLLKTEDSPASALATQEAAYRNAIKDLPSSGRPEPTATPSGGIPGFEGLDDREFAPITTPSPTPKSPRR